MAIDYVVITTSSPAQTENFRALVRSRTAAGIYPASVEFRFYCDPPGGRVGSGGGTLLALANLLVDETVADDQPAAAAAHFFGSKRTLIVHAGGEARRLPCYVPEGKLFAPLLLACTTAQPPTVLDVLLTLYTSYPWAKGETVVCSGDVIVHFDAAAALPAEFRRGDLCGFGTATSLEQGTRHGVFGCALDSAAATDPTLPVLDFFQKAPVETLRAAALLPRASAAEPEHCAVDTGIFSMSGRFVCALLAWVTRDWAEELTPAPVDSPGSHSSGGASSPGSVLARVRRASLYFDFYLEVVAATLPGADCESYVRRMLNNGSRLPPDVLASLHEHASELELRAAYVAGARFLHFGSLPEYAASATEVAALRLAPFYATGQQVDVVSSRSAELATSIAMRALRALVSMSDKTGLTEFVKGLHAHGVTILSTGGAAKTICEAGVPCTDVSEYTQSSEAMDGRVGWGRGGRLGSGIEVLEVNCLDCRWSLGRGG